MDTTKDKLKQTLIVWITEKKDINGKYLSVITRHVNLGCGSTTDPDSRLDERWGLPEKVKDFQYNHVYFQMRKELPQYKAEIEQIKKEALSLMVNMSRPCSRCGEVRSADCFNETSRQICYQCLLKSAKKYYNENPEKFLIRTRLFAQKEKHYDKKTKVCKKCHKEKDLSCFGVHKMDKTGYRSECKQCIKEYNDEYRKNNKKYWVDYFDKNREKWSAYVSERRKKIKERENEQTKTTSKRELKVLVELEKSTLSTLKIIIALTFCMALPMRFPLTMIILLSVEFFYGVMVKRKINQYSNQINVIDDLEYDEMWRDNEKNKCHRCGQEINNGVYGPDCAKIVLSGAEDDKWDRIDKIEAKKVLNLGVFPFYTSGDKIESIELNNHKELDRFFESYGVYSKPISLHLRKGITGLEMLLVLLNKEEDRPKNEDELTKLLPSTEFIMFDINELNCLGKFCYKINTSKKGKGIRDFAIRKKTAQIVETVNQFIIDINEALKPE